MKKTAHKHVGKLTRVANKHISKINALVKSHLHKLYKHTKKHLYDIESQHKKHMVERDISTNIIWQTKKFFIKSINHILLQNPINMMNTLTIMVLIMMGTRLLR